MTRHENCIIIKTRIAEKKLIKLLCFEAYNWNTYKKKNYALGTTALIHLIDLLLYTLKRNNKFNITQHYILPANDL